MQSFRIPVQVGRMLLPGKRCLPAFARQFHGISAIRFNEDGKGSDAFGTETSKKEENPFSTLLEAMDEKDKASSIDPYAKPDRFSKQTFEDIPEHDFWKIEKEANKFDLSQREEASQSKYDWDDFDELKDNEVLLPDELSAAPNKYQITGQKDCVFCAHPHDPEFHIEYTNVRLLHKFINDRGMITHRQTSKNCRRHQRQVQKAIEQARFIGLMPYTIDWSLGEPELDPEEFDLETDFENWQNPPFV